MVDPVITRAIEKNTGDSPWPAALGAMQGRAIGSAITLESIVTVNSDRMPQWIADKLREIATGLRDAVDSTDAAVA
jgi:hypothetical protein